MEWDKDVIVVLRDVRISPPYDPENCEGSQPACDRIKKQVCTHKHTHSHTYTCQINCLLEETGL